MNIIKAKVFSHKQQIGTANLQVGDESMGGVFGDFFPNNNYYREIQGIVWRFWETNIPDYEKWVSLRLNVQLENGYFLFPLGGYTFDDCPELLDEPKRIDIAGLDWHIIEDYFVQKQQCSFVKESWSELTIQQKIAFEDELQKEHGEFSSNVRLSALCHDQRNGDVLFTIDKQDFDDKYAVVHLTWIGEKEEKDYLHVEFYREFEYFKRLRMNVENIECKSGKTNGV